MKGIPKILSTKHDWLNMYEYTLAEGSKTDKETFKKRLNGLKNTGTVLMLKKGVSVLPEEQVSTDFELVTDKGSRLARTNFSIAEIDLMISKLS